MGHRVLEEGLEEMNYVDMTPEMAVALYLSHKYEEEGNETEAVDAYVEYKRLEYDEFVRTIGDRELYEMGL